MSAGLPTITQVATSNGTSAAGVTIIGAAGFPTNTAIGDLVMFAVYERGGNLSTTPPRDTADGLIFLDYGYNTTNGFGMILAAWICTFENKANFVGMTIPSATTHTYCMTTFRISSGYSFVPSQGCGSSGLGAGWFNATATAVTLSAPAIAQPYAQCFDVIARGYGADGTGITTDVLTGFTESVDTGQLSPPNGIVMNYRTVTNHNINPLISSNLSVTKIDRGGVRAMIPIVAKTSFSNRYMTGRRTA